MKYLFRCTRGHFHESVCKTTRDLAWSRCTERVVRVRGTIRVLDPCRCKFTRVKTRALNAAYALGGLPAVLDLVCEP